MSFADVIERETAWLTTEPLAGFPALLAGGGSDGSFDFIGERTRRLAQHSRQVHVYRERSVETRASTATKRIIHDMLLGVLWTQQLNSEQAHTEQRQLDDALERLVTRVRGLLDDHTHGGRFWSAGEDGGMSPSSPIDVRWPDWRAALVNADSPLAVGRAFVVEVRYPIIEFVGG